MDNYEFNIFDKINLEELCDEIIAFAGRYKRSNSKLTDYTSREKILRSILPEDDEWNREISTLNKMPSGNVSGNSLKILTRKIEKSDFRTDLMKNCSDLENAIRSVKPDAGTGFISKLKNSCNRMYFINDEFEQIEKYSDASAADPKNNFIGILFLHALTCVTFNLPYYASMRSFHEALTLTPGTEMHVKMLKCSADNGNGYAALMYANYVYKSSPETALDYYIMASGFKQMDKDFKNGKPSKSVTESNALWEIAFMFENHYIPVSYISYVEKYVSIDSKLQTAIDNRNKKNSDEGTRYEHEKIKEKTSRRDYLLGFSKSENEIDNITRYTTDESVKYALKLYLYIILKDLSFPKALNSIGKLVLGDYLASSLERIPTAPIKKERFATAMDYLHTAVNFGNINAMVNIAVYYHNQTKLGRKLTEAQTSEMNYFLETAVKFKDPEAIQHWGAILMSNGETEKAHEYLEHSANRNVSEACHSLGIIYAEKMDDDKAIEYLEKAINLNCYDAAYDLAKLYLRKSVKADSIPSTQYLQYAIYLIKDRISEMTDDYKVKSEEFLKKFDR